MQPHAGHGRAARFERVAGVWAVHGTAPSEASLREGLERVRLDDLSAASWRLPPGEDARWHDTGWTFVRDSGPGFVERALKADVPPREPWARVYVRDGKQVVLAAGDVLVAAPRTWSPAKILHELQAADLGHVHAFQAHPGIVSARHHPWQDPYEVCERLRTEHGFRAAEPDFMLRLEPAWRPDDPDYGLQWSWRVPRRATAGASARGGIAAERAWDQTRGAGTCIAVIDGGFDAGQPDFHGASGGAVHPASGRFEQDPVTGARRFVVGPVASQEAVQTQHGTKCAGRAGARANNGSQGCGLAPEADLLLVATNGVTSTSVMARAFEYCVNPQAEDPSLDAAPGADAITCSLHTDFVTSWLAAFLMRMVLCYAGSVGGRGGLGAFIAWAAPNTASSVDVDPIFRSPHVAVVAASDGSDRVPMKDGKTNQGYGKRLFCVAPGIDVCCNFASSSPGVPGTLRMDTGCSYAAPLVAALAALCVSVRPQLGASSVRKFIGKSCDRVGDVGYGPLGHHPDYGHGRIHATQTIRAVLGIL